VSSVLAAAALVAGVSWVLFRPDDGHPIEPEPTVPRSRDARTWPFAWDSIWNLPVGRDARLVAAGMDLEGSVVGADEDILVLEPDAPATDVVVNEAGWDGSRSRCGEADPDQVLIEDVPIPTGFSTDPGYLGGTPNHSAALLQADGRTIVQTQPFHRCGAGGLATSQFLFDSDDIVDGDGIRGAHGGSMMSSLGGTIRLGELVPGGAIHHALKLNVNCAQWCSFADDEADGNPGHRWPAVAADDYAPGTYGGTNLALQMGSLLVLPADFDLTGLHSEAARIIARAMRDHGAYIVDDTAYPAVNFTTEWSPDGRVIDEFARTWGFAFAPDATIGCDAKDAGCRWANDIGSVMAALRVVDDNAPDTIGGAGARRVACAPAFADGRGGAPASCSPSPGRT
jgi:hypothetical protein